MNSPIRARSLGQLGKIRTGVLLWALGVPIPILLVLWLFKGCA